MVVVEISSPFCGAVIETFGATHGTSYLTLMFFVSKPQSFEAFKIIEFKPRFRLSAATNTFVAALYDPWTAVPFTVRLIWLAELTLVTVA